MSRGECGGIFYAEVFSRDDIKVKGEKGSGGRHMCRNVGSNGTSSFPGDGLKGGVRSCLQTKRAIGNPVFSARSKGLGGGQSDGDKLSG